MIRLLWHVFRYGHSVTVNRNLTPPMWDPFCKGWLYRCECGMTQAR